MTQSQETEMDKTNEAKAHPEVREDLIELGSASAETKGGTGITEGVGTLALPGISDK